MDSPDPLFTSFGVDFAFPLADPSLYQSGGKAGEPLFVPTLTYKLSELGTNLIIVLITLEMILKQCGFHHELVNFS